MLERSAMICEEQPHWKRLYEQYTQGLPLTRSHIEQIFEINASADWLYAARPDTR
jgi:hypothetical protein